MEFWGVEVKPGLPLKVKPDHGQLIHVSQAAFGEPVKDVKGAKNIHLRMKIDDKDFVIGSLKPEERTQLMFDLVFEREFELSHDWKNGSVYFIGYLAADQSPEHADYSSGDIDSSDESEDEPLENPGKASANGVAKVAKDPAAAAAVKTETKKDESSGSDDDDDVSEDGSDDEDMALSLGGDSSDDLSGDDSEEDDSEDEEEELPKQSKKRPIESAQAAPVSAKKAKSATPETTGNKDQKASGKNATGKTPPGDKSKQSPKSGGKFSGKSGNKSFNSKTGKGKRGGK